MKKLLFTFSTAFIVMTSLSPAIAFADGGDQPDNSTTQAQSINSVQQTQSTSSDSKDSTDQKSSSNSIQNSVQPSDAQNNSQKKSAETQSEKKQKEAEVHQKLTQFKVEHTKLLNELHAERNLVQNERNANHQLKLSLQSTVRQYISDLQSAIKAGDTQDVTTGVTQAKSVISDLKTALANQKATQSSLDQSSQYEKQDTPVINELNKEAESAGLLSVPTPQFTGLNNAISRAKTALNYAQDKNQILSQALSSLKNLDTTLQSNLSQYKSPSASSNSVG